MHVENAAQWATVIGSGIAALALLATFVVSFVTARSANQRTLRERLRQQLRQMDLACYVHFRREGWEAIRKPPQYSFHALDQIHQDGLLSPNRAHIERIKKTLRELRNSQEALAAPAEDIFAVPSEVAKARVDGAFENLSSVVPVYLRALGKMDNAGFGGYWTYLRYRLAPPGRRHGEEE